MRDNHLLTAVHDLLGRSARARPEALAIVHGRRSVSYDSLNRQADAVAAHLSRRGFQKGERAGICIDNSPDYVVAYFGILKAGGVVVPFSTQASWRGILKILVDCRPTVLFAQASALPAVCEAVRRGGEVGEIVVAALESGKVPSVTGVQADLPPSVATRVLGTVANGSVDGWTPGTTRGEDLAMILYTSGTTGTPKGVMLTHGNLSSNALSIVQYLNLTWRDKSLVVLPFHYSYGNSLLTTHVLAGASLVIGESFVYPNAVLDQMIAEEVTGFSGVPTTFVLLLHRSNLRNCRFPKLRYVTQAGGPMSPRHALALSQILPDTEIFIMYGLTEAAPRVTFLEPREILRKAGSIGKAIPGVKVVVQREDGTEANPEEQGELVVTGDNVMAGYWNDPEGTSDVLRPDGLHTGDVGWRDKEGFLYLVGRRSEMIKSGAHRICPKEIEEVLLEIPGVHEAAVVGEKDEVLGESITAFVVGEDGEYPSGKEILGYCRKNLPPYHIPKKVLFLDRLPKTESGKIRKQDLVQRF